MLKFKNIHIYCNQANTLDFNAIVPGLQKYFRNIPIDVRYPFLSNIDNVLAESLVSIRISDIKKPFNEQPRIKIQGKSDQNAAYEKNFPTYLPLRDITNSNSDTKMQYKELILYDGFMMQRLFETMINESESNTDHVHIVFEDRLICTFSEEDWRYHARTIVGGSPSIISTTGIVEAPAKPKEWYIKQMQLATCNVYSNGDENDVISSDGKEKYLDYGDYRINFAAVGYALQALFFFITEGNPFCNNIDCRLYNAHWQEELIYSQIRSQRLCNEHATLLHQFD
ncbi:MAG TPA: DUF6775 family putative metallopeptidase [Candidatus Bathyarchaeia archaeon]|nr:DUF6775 family putative metallopeptidase [Candidatus Bathyarchaeia archaeon]